MMNNKHVTNVCLIATLVMTAASATAGQPSGQGGGAPSKQGIQPAQAKCFASKTENQHDDNRPPQGGYGAKVRALPEYVRGLLRDEGKADLNGTIDPCRLVDNDPDDGAATNDGVDVHELLAKIDDWTAMNRRSLGGNEHGLDWRGQQVTFEFEGRDHRLHAYVGYSRIDSDRLMPRLQQWQPLAWNSGLSANGGLGQLRDAASTGNQQFLLNSNTQPVPEPSAWAMLLAGLAMIGLAWWRRAGSTLIERPPTISAIGIT